MKNINFERTVILEIENFERTLIIENVILEKTRIIGLREPFFYKVIFKERLLLKLWNIFENSTNDYLYSLL